MIEQYKHMNRKTLLVVTPDSDLNTFLQDFLTQNGYVVKTTESSYQALQFVVTHRPSLVIFDVNLEDQTPQSFCSELARSASAVACLLLVDKGTSKDNKADYLNIGAQAIIEKPLSNRLLLAKIETILESESNQAEKLTFNSLSVNLKTHQVTEDDTYISLSPKEFRLLVFFMRNQNQVLVRERILSHLWEGQYDVDTRVVDVYVAHLRKKLGQKNIKYIHTVRSFGYWFGKKPKS